MKSFPLGVLLAMSLIVATAGCSEQTKTETRQALDETGDAVESAVEDTKENAKKVGDAAKAGVESAREAWEDDDAEPVTPVIPPTSPGTP